MTVNIGIRREDKNKWERRTPLTPDDVAQLQGDGSDVRFLIQPSPIRIYPDEAYTQAGAKVTEKLDDAAIVLAVKEIPEKLLEASKAYVYFAHVIKGQPQNMPTLSRLLELGSTLIDYERIVDEADRRLVFFGFQAGQAGMIETLRALGQRLAMGGESTPFWETRQAHEYDDAEAGKEHLREIGEKIKRDGLPEELSPLVIGVSGYGNVARGANDVLDCLPITEISVDELPTAHQRTDGILFKVIFKECDMVQPLDEGAAFDLQEYYDHPELYRGRFADHLEHLDLLVNTIYWEDRYPRLVTKQWARDAFARRTPPRLRVIGDISCDIGGSIEMTAKATEPDKPCFVWHPATDEIASGFEGKGLVVMAVDNLPCELPRDASQAFSAALRKIVPDLVATNWRASFDDLGLPPSLSQAVITHQGKLAPSYAYLEELI